MELNWSITGLQTTPLPDGSSDVVTWIQWRCYGIDHLNNVIAEAIDIGFVENPISTSGLFIPSNELTDADILCWVWNSGVDKAQVEMAVTDAINQQIAGAQ